MPGSHNGWTRRPFSVFLSGLRQELWHVCRLDRAVQVPSLAGLGLLTDKTDEIP